MTEPLEITDGEIELPTGPGWGTDINDEALAKYPAEDLPAIEGRARYYPE